MGIGNLAFDAYDAGCIRFDGVIKGFGGCPMAETYEYRLNENC